MHLIQQMPFQSAQSPTAMFKPLRQQVFSSHIKKANALHWLFFRPIRLFWFTAIRLSYGSGGQQSNRYYGYSKRVSPRNTRQKIDDKSGNCVSYSSFAQCLMLLSSAKKSSLSALSRSGSFFTARDISDIVGSAEKYVSAR